MTIHAESCNVITIVIIGVEFKLIITCFLHVDRIIHPLASHNVADSVIAFTYPWKKGDSKVYTYKFTAKDKDNNKVFQGSKNKDDSDELLLELSN